MTEEVKEVINENKVEGTAPQTADVEQVMTTEQPTFEGYKIKHLDDEIFIDSKDKEKEFVQKGADYDRIKSKYEEIKTSKALKVLQDLAAEKGSTIDDVAEEIDKERLEKRIRKYAEEKEIDDFEQAKYFYELEQYKSKGDKKSEEQKAKEAEEKDLADFIDFYEKSFGEEPDPNKIPREVFEMVKNEKKSLIDAYLRHTFLEQQKSKKIEEHNKENADATVPNVSKTGDIKDTSVITDEVLENMSAEEMERRWSEVSKFLAKKKQQ